MNHDKLESNNHEPKLTIGQLARRVGLNASTLRYYEEEGLLPPAERSESGYRLYRHDDEQLLRFIQRAQRLGFSLHDIRLLLEKIKLDQLSDAEIMATAEKRFLAIEKQVTQWLVLRHEMGLFLRDIYSQPARANHNVANHLFEQLVERVCSDPRSKPLETTLDWLLQKTGCQLTTAEGQQLIEKLSGHHTHVWQEGHDYHILLVSDDPKVFEALEQLTTLEETCQAHEPGQKMVSLRSDREGYLVVAEGENAFLYARLFLSIAN